MIKQLTEGEALTVNGRTVTARDLAAARQQLSHEGVYNPRWDELTPEDHERAAIIAAGYLRALGHLLDDRPGYAIGTEERA